MFDPGRPRIIIKNLFYFKKISIVKFILFFSSILIFSQEYNFSYNYVNYNINNGFISSQVNFGFKDSRNFLWITTDKGITRYNGLDYINYTVKEGLSENSILGGFEDENKNIWFYADNFTLNVFNIKTNKITPFVHNASILKQTFGSAINALFVKDSKVYLVFKNYGYVIIHENGKITMKNSKVIYDKNIGFFVLNNNKLDPIIWNETKLPNTFSQYFSKFKNVEISYNKNWTTFISDENKVSIANNKSLEYKEYQSNSKINSITLNYLNSNELLLSTNNGLIKYFLTNNQTITYLNEFQINYTISNTNAGYFALSQNNGLFNIKNNEVLTLYKNKEKYVHPEQYIP